MILFRSIPHLFIFLTIIFFATQGHAAEGDPLGQALLFTLESNPTQVLGFVSNREDPAVMDRSLLALYIKRQLRPLWVTDKGPGSKAAELLQVLKSSDEDGLRPSDYQVTAMEELWGSNNPIQLASLDVLLTLGLNAYTSDMQEGRADPCQLDPRLFASARDQVIDIQNLVNRALSVPNLTAFLQAQAPTHSSYLDLRRTLASYRQMAEAGEWEPFPAGPTLKPDMIDKRIPSLINRLSKTGLLDDKTIRENTNIYTPELVSAVKAFQQQFNLEIDGIIGPKTQKALGIPLDDLIKRIIINMERWRWLPHRLDDKRILVNIAGFSLSGIREEKLEIQMPVIVGKVYHKTPVFSDALRYIVFNPYWNIPPSIAVNETVHQQQENPAYLKENHIRIFDGWQENAPEIDPSTIDWQTIGKGIRRYRLRQDAGPDNALGTIKFMFPNAYNIYLHDTPGRELFKQTNRSFSHGCIRVSNPRQLALYLLQGNKDSWDLARIDGVISSGKRTVVLLDQPIPLHILYRTVGVDPASGTISFYEDLYGRDALLKEALFDESNLQQCRFPQ